MAAAPIDYAALAKQAGAISSTGPVDYAALAKQAGAIDSQPAPTAAPAPQPSMLQRIGSTASDLGKGVISGGLHTYGNVMGMIPGLGNLHDPLPGANHGKTLAQENQEMQQAIAPQNTAQTIGRGVEQAGEFLIPGGAEEKAAAKAAELLPQLKYAAPVAKLVAQGLGSGAVNAAQGGSFATGAAAGAAGGAVGMGLQKIAPSIVDSALGMRAADRKFARQPGKAILDETTGFTPAKIVQQATDKVAGWGNQVGDLLNNATGSVDLTPARAITSDVLGKAGSMNSPDALREATKLNTQLTTSAVNGQGIPSVVSPSQADALKKGVGYFKGNWNSKAADPFIQGAAGQAYHAIDSGIDAAVPGYGPLNDNISSMLPAVERAKAADLNANVTQRVLGRFARPTGALVGSTLGFMEGEKNGGGISGGLAGGAAGLIAPEMLASPTTLMMLARGAYSPATQKAIQLLAGTALQANRPAKP